MDPYFEEIAMSRKILRTRLVLIVVALITALAGAWGLINVRAIATYNEATRTLNTSIRQARNPQADPAAIKALQDQADRLFDQAARPGPLLLPKTRQAAQANQATSTALTQRTERVLKKQQADKTKNGQDGKSGSGKGSSSGLTKQQEAEVEDLLKRNQQQSDPSSSPNPTGNTGGHQDQEKGVKPW